MKVVRVLLLEVFAAVAVQASSMPTIVVDENGNMVINGSSSQGYFSNDPGPAGLSHVLTYNLPFQGVQGDVLLFDFCGCVEDVLRFNGNGTLIFYSDGSSAIDSAADTFSAPSDTYSNFLTVSETGNATFDSASYTPQSGKPGFDPANPTYVFLSDGSIPEPASMWLTSAGLSGLAYLRMRRQN